MPVYAMEMEPQERESEIGDESPVVSENTGDLFFIIICTYRNLYKMLWNGSKCGILLCQLL